MMMMMILYIYIYVFFCICLFFCFVLKQHVWFQLAKLAGFLFLFFLNLFSDTLLNVFLAIAVDNLANAQELTAAEEEQEGVRQEVSFRIIQFSYQWNCHWHENWITHPAFGWILTGWHKASKRIVLVRNSCLHEPWILRLCTIAMTIRSIHRWKHVVLFLSIYFLFSLFLLTKY